MENGRENRNCRDNCLMNGGDWRECMYAGLEKWADIMRIAGDVEQQVENINSFMNEYKYVKCRSEMEEFLFLEIRNSLSSIYRFIERILDKKEKQFAEMLQGIILNKTAGESFFCGGAEYVHALALWEAGEFMEDLKEIIAVSDRTYSAEDILNELSEYHV